MPDPRRAFLLVTILAFAGSAFAQINIANFDFGSVPVICGSGIAFGYQGPYERCQWPYPFQNFNAAPGFGWTLNMAPSELRGGQSGVTAPNGAFNLPPFDGLPFSQAGLLQDHGGHISQAIGGFTPGNYVLSFYLGSRYRDPPYDGNQNVQALVDG